MPLRILEARALRRRKPATSVEHPLIIEDEHVARSKLAFPRVLARVPTQVAVDAASIAAIQQTLEIGIGLVVSIHFLGRQANGPLKRRTPVHRVNLPISRGGRGRRRGRRLRTSNTLLGQPDVRPPIRHPRPIPLFHERGRTPRQRLEALRPQLPQPMRRGHAVDERALPSHHGASHADAVEELHPRGGFVICQVHVGGEGSGGVRDVVAVAFADAHVEGFSVEGSVGEGSAGHGFGYLRYGEVVFGHGF
mmetsp:Transcript_24642/g.40140  ORF Transcript_24642/g.40140 Transcript_24642/m.40140 type:complete len:250 (-) Transcript_24642:310-1059(-)